MTEFSTTSSTTPLPRTVYEYLYKSHIDAQTISADSIVAKYNPKSYLTYETGLNFREIESKYILPIVEELSRQIEEQLDVVVDRDRIYKLFE